MCKPFTFIITALLLPLSYAYGSNITDAFVTALQDRNITRQERKHKTTDIKSTKTANKYMCKVKELTSISEIEAETFDISNGAVDGDIYSIVINENTLSFTNTSNNATFQMNYNPETTEFEAGWYSFKFNNNDRTFVFAVNKPNYSVNYLGECLEK